MGAPPVVEHFCAEHARARAGWICGACGRQLCPDCVGEKQLRMGSATLCMHCGGLAPKITRPRRIEPFWEMFPRFLHAIFSSDGLVQLLAIAVVMYLVSWLPGFLGSIAVAFVYVTYYFRVISYAAAGGERLPDPEDFLGWESIFPPILRFMVASATIWAPAALYIAYGLGFGSLLDGGPSALLDPILFFLVVAGLVYFPAAIIAAAVANSVVAVVNPLITVRLILRIPGQYAITWATWAGLSVLDIALRAGMSAAASVLSVPIFTALLVQLISLIIPVLTGMVLGRLVYQNAEQFGLLGAGEDVEEVWPEATPRGVLTLETKGADTRAHVEPVEIEGWGHDVPAAAPPAPPVEVPRAAPAPAPWAAAPMLADHEPLDLELDGAASDAPEVVPDTHGWIAEAAAGPGAPWTIGADTTVQANGSGWMEDAEDGTDLELGLDGSADLAADLALDPPEPGAEVAGGLFAAAQLGPSAELRPGQGAPTTPSAEAPRTAPAPAAPAPTEDDGRLRFALEQGDTHSALARFRTRPAGRYPPLGPRLELRLAGMLERDGDLVEAVRACQRAVADEPAGSFAPRALFMAGRIFAERLQDPAGARRMWSHLERTFPHDQLAELARVGIRKLG